MSTLHRMRWERLFEDIEHELESLDASPKRALETERLRLSRSKITLKERIFALADNQKLSLQLQSGVIISGTLRNTGPDHLGIERDGVALEHPLLMLPLKEIAAVNRISLEDLDDLPSGSAKPRSIRPSAVVYSALARRRLAVRVSTSNGAMVSGTISAVWGDHLEFWVHDADKAPRRTNIEEVRLITFMSITQLSANHQLATIW